MELYFISGSYSSSDGKGNFYTGFCNSTINVSAISKLDLEELTLIEIFEQKLEHDEQDRQGNICSCTLISYQIHNTEIGYQPEATKILTQKDG